MMAGAASSFSKFMEKPGAKRMVVGGALLIAGLVMAFTGGGIGLGLIVGAATAYVGYKRHTASQVTGQQSGQDSQFPPQSDAGRDSLESFAPQTAPPDAAQNQRGSIRGTLLSDQQNQDDQRVQQVAERARSVEPGYSPQAGVRGALRAQEVAVSFHRPLSSQRASAAEARSSSPEISPPGLAVTTDTIHPLPAPIIAGNFAPPGQGTEWLGAPASSSSAPHRMPSAPGPRRAAR